MCLLNAIPPNICLSIHNARVGKGHKSDKINHRSRLTVIHSRAILVAVTSECYLKGVSCKTWTSLSAGTLANSADSDRTPLNVASDQDCMVCLITGSLGLNETVLSPRS